MTPFKSKTKLIGKNAQHAFGAVLWDVLKHSQRREVVYLHGDLGAGKTTLVRGLIQASGYVGGVKSPTYTLVESYDVGEKRIHHFDLYRLGEPLEFEYIGGQEYFVDDAICLIEWPEKAIGVLPPATLDITLTHAGDARTIELKRG